MVEVVPTILVKSAKAFEERLRLVALLVKRVQWDIMDGVFVDNTTFSDVSILKALDIKLPIEADLMVADPQNWIERFADTQVDRLVFHVESTSTPEVLIQDARAAGFEVGLTLDPDTPLKQVSDYLGKIDLFQAMGVKSGWGGQEFVRSVLDRIGEVRRDFPKLPISVDGGINSETAPEIIAAGANILCVGSYVFNSDNIESAIEELRQIGS
jgi:ribulose-phosphate 3-epimerase